MTAYTILFQTKKYQPVILLELEDIQRTFFSLADEKERKQEQLLIYNLSLAYLLKHLYGVNILYLYQIQEDVKNKVSSIWQSYKQLYALAEGACNQVLKGLESIANH